MWQHYEQYKKSEVFNTQFAKYFNILVLEYGKAARILYFVLGDIISVLQSVIATL